MAFGHAAEPLALPGGQEAPGLEFLQVMDVALKDALPHHDSKLLNRQMFTPSVRLEGPEGPEGPQLGWGARRAQTARYL
jgi:hypothetical protein